MKILYFGVLIRILIVYINLYIYEIPGLNEDALTFHRLASDFSNGNEIEKFYNTNSYYAFSWMLGYIYTIFTDSIFFGHLINIFIWFLSGIVLHKTLKIVNTSYNFCNCALLIYTLLPTSIFFSSAIIREPFMLLILNLALYYWVKYFLSENKLNNALYFFFILIISYLSSQYFHYAFTFIFSILVIFVLMTGILNKYKNKYKVLLLTGFIAAIFIYLNDSILLYLAGFFEKSQSYRFSTTIGNSTYEVALSGNIFTNAFYSFYQFLIQPTLSSLNSLSSYVIFFDNSLKLFMIFTFFFSISLKEKKYHFLFFCIFLFYLISIFIWSLGTTNWGTSSRHSMSEIGILIFFYFGNLRKQLLKKRIFYFFDIHK